MRKGIYEQMHSWKKFYRTLLPDKEDLYSDLKMEDNLYADYMHAKRARELSRSVSCFVRSK